jgi:hypothetical protein
MLADSKPVMERITHHIHSHEHRLAQEQKQQSSLEMEPALSVPKALAYTPKRSIPSTYVERPNTGVFVSCV